MPIPGGAYTAVQNTDGTWNIKDVPIMAEVKKGDKRAPFDVTKEWLSACVLRARDLFKNGKYLAPLHIKHHEMGQETQRAGFFLPTQVKTILYDGSDTDAILADLLSIPDAIFRRIEKGELPYRSVEIAKWETPEINSLALLDDDAPFFRFELLTIGKKVPQGDAVVLDTEMAPAWAYASATDGGGAILFKFGDEDKKKPNEEKEGEEDKGANAEEDKGPMPDGKVPSCKMCGTKCAACDSKMGGKGGSMGAGAGPGAEGAGDLAMDKATYDEVMSIKAMLVNILGPGYMKEPGRVPTDKPVEMPEAKKNEEPKKKPIMAKEESMNMEEVAKLTARLAAIEQIEAARAKEEGVAKLVAKATAELKGYPLNEGAVAKLKVIAEKGGEDAVNAFVSSYKEAVPKDPPRSLGEYEARVGVQDPDEVKKFSAMGPEALEKARKFSAMYDQLKGRTAATRERFIEIQFNAENGKYAEARG